MKSGDFRGRYPGGGRSQRFSAPSTSCHSGYKKINKQIQFLKNFEEFREIL